VGDACAAANPFETAQTTLVGYLQSVIIEVGRRMPGNCASPGVDDQRSVRRDEAKKAA